VVNATARLRIKGRFLTNEHAAAILGITVKQVVMQGRESIQQQLTKL